MSGGASGLRARGEAALCPRRRQQVCEAVTAWIDEAARRYSLSLPPLPVRFDLYGVVAGSYQVRGASRLLRFNPLIFGRYFAENLRDTVPHEVAHYVVDVRYGRRRARPHGVEWRQVMTDFGIDPAVRHHFDLDGLDLRRQRRYRYRCGCTVHEVSTVRHRRMHEGRMVYRCRRCGQALQPEESA